MLMYIYKLRNWQENQGLYALCDKPFVLPDPEMHITPHGMDLQFFIHQFQLVNERYETWNSHLLASSNDDQGPFSVCCLE